MTLYLKIHPSTLSYLISTDDYGVVNLLTDLTRNVVYMRQLFDSIQDKGIERIVIEKPFLKLIGDNKKKLAEQIIHIQRTTGALLTLIVLYFPDARVEQISARTARTTVYGTEYISKDVQLSEAYALLKDLKEREFTALEILTLHDTLVLKSFISKR